MSSRCEFAWLSEDANGTLVEYTCLLKAGHGSRRHIWHDGRGGYVATLTTSVSVGGGAVSGQSGD